jgi:hypothetical protein
MASAERFGRIGIGIGNREPGSGVFGKSGAFGIRESSGIFEGKFAGRETGLHKRRGAGDYGIV